MEYFIREAMLISYKVDEISSFKSSINFDLKKFSEFILDLKGEFRENYPLANLTWFKVGGNAEIFFIPNCFYYNLNY